MGSLLHSARARPLRSKTCSGDIADLADEHLLQPPDAVPEWRDIALELRTGKAKPVPEMRSVEEKMEHVAAGSGVSIIPLSVATFYQRPDVAAVPVTDLAANKVCLAWMASRRSRLIYDFAELAGKDVSGTALRPETSMAVASITKTFVAAEVLLLANAKTVDLDAPISTYVQHKLTANQATVRQHLSMTSGVPDFLPDDYGRLDQAVTMGPGRHWTAVQTLSYLTAPIEAPNSTYSYSNPNYLLLGQLIENVTGQPYTAALRRDLAAPAGLRHAAFQDGEKPQPPAVVDDNESCADLRDGYLPCRAFASGVGAAGGLAADAPTIARWGYQLYGGRVLPTELVSEMTKGDGDYGLGTMLFTRRFGIGTAFGHQGEMPDHTSLLVVIPEKKVSVALLLADGGRTIETAMGQLTQALEPLLG